MMRVGAGRRGYGDLEVTDFISRVKGVVFIATPHSGSIQATVLDKLRLIAWPSPSTLDLVRNDPSLRDLNGWYRNWADHNHIQHKVFCEKQGTLAGVIVDDASSDPGLLHVTPVDVDADHLMICKPADPTDLVYERTRDFLEEIVKNNCDSTIAYGANHKCDLPEIGRAIPNRFVPIAIRLAAIFVLAILVFTGVRALIPAPSVPLTHVVVLPFQSDDQDNSIDRLSTSVPFAIDSQLTDTPDLWVVPMKSLDTLPKNPSPRQVRRALRAGTMIEGAVRRSGERLSVDVEVINTNQNRQLWSRTFEMAVVDQQSRVRQIVSQVTAAVQQRLKVKTTSVPTQDDKAYELYVKGLVREEDITNVNNNDAIADLEAAVRLDPGFAQAHAALAEAYATRFYWNFSNDRHLVDEAEASAREALKLAPRSPEAHNALGWSLESKGEPLAAAREYFASAHSNPHYLPALQNVARFSIFMADFDRALATLGTIADIDPTINVSVRRAICYYFAGNSPAALRENKEAERAARGVDQLTLVAFTYVWLMDLDSAERVLQRLQQQDPKALSIAEIRAWLYTARGQFPEAQEQIKTIATRETFGIEAEIATFYALQGDREQAIAWLTKGVQDGAANYAWYNSDFFKILRGDPRYEKILAQLRDEYRQLRKEISAFEEQRPPSPAASLQAPRRSSAEIDAILQ